jgi:solute carrier family 13 (sodium-dependent dicarboxylate transporter), member 2/3/5
VLPVLILTVSYGANLGGMATIIGSGENAIASGALAQVMPFNFLDWMAYALPLTILLLPMSWYLIMKTNGVPNVRLDTSEVKAEIDRVGPLSSSEKEIVMVMLVSAILWITGGTVERMLGLPTTLLSSVIVAIGAVAYLSFTEIIDWNDMKGVNWGVFLVVGAGLALGNAMESTGASDWIASVAEPLLSALPYYVTLFAVLVLTFMVTQVLNSITLGAILSPLLVALSQASGISPLRLVLPAILTLAFCYMLPGSSTRNALVALTGAVDRKTMLRTGFIVGVPSMLAVYFFFLMLSVVGLI